MFWTSFERLMYVQFTPVSRGLMEASQLTFSCSKLIMEPLEKGVKYVQS